MNSLTGQILTGHLKDGPSGIDIIYFGRSNEGAFKLIFENQTCPFFIPREAQFNPAEFSFERASKPLKSFNDQDVDVIYLKKLGDINKAKRYCEQMGIRSYEIDVSLTERFLMERFIFSSVEIQGDSESAGDIKIFKNPQIRASKKKQALSQMSIDIETGVNEELYSIAYAYEYEDQKVNHVFMLADKNQKIHEELDFCASEREVWLGFLTDLNRLDPDILCGWHVIGFDFMFLEKKCQKWGLEFSIGREGRKVQLDFRQGVGYLANVYGRIVLDGPPVLRGAFYQFPNFKLETVASQVLGIGKDIASDENKVSEIERRFKEDKEALAKYNLLDCTLVNDIFKKLGIVELLKERSRITGLTMDRLNVSTAAFDFIYLPKLHRKGYIAPNRSDIEREEGAAGGLVMEPVQGLHKNIMVFDFKSLYPSIIRTFSIGPYSLLKNSENTISTPEGFKFSNTEHILPEIISELFEKRAMAKFNKDMALSQAIKILMNSFYGIMGSSRSRFYHADLPQAITTTGHYLLRSARDFFENHGYEVVYGDTDSVFVKNTKEQDPVQLVGELNEFLGRLIKNEFHIDSALECEYEKTFDLLYFSPMRSGVGAAKKRYAGYVAGELEFKGMEAVRSDWTVLAKRFQHKLFQIFFEGDDPESFIRSEIKNLEEGKYNNDLVYTKRLSKPAHEYTKNIPVHVKAALKVNHTGPYPLREVNYIMTRNGPEPLQNDPSDFDYDHYIDKQLKPIADDVLVYLGTTFDSLRLGDQLSLF